MWWEFSRKRAGMSEMADRGVVEFAVGGMTCGSCANRVQRTLAKQPGVMGAEVNFVTGTATVVLGGQAVEPDALRVAVQKAGYELTLPEPAGEADAQPDDPEDHEVRAERSWRGRVLAGWPLAVAVGVLAMVPGPWMHEPWAHWAQLVLTTPVQFVVGWPFLREAARRARRLSANMDTLIAIGTLTAYSYSATRLLFFGGELYFETAALIIAFLVLGRYFEARAKRRAGHALREALAGPSHQGV
jgi:cation-transporting ATPase V